MNVYGNPVTRLIEELASLPGIGGKSAQRLAFHIIHMPREKVAALSEAILDAKDQVRYCSVDGGRFQQSSSSELHSNLDSIITGIKLLS